MFAIAVIAAVLRVETGTFVAPLLLLLHGDAMKRGILMIFVLCASCGNMSPPPTSMPWLSGFRTTAVSDTPVAAVSQRLAELVNGDDGDAYGGIEVHADVTGDARNETVLASYHQGLVVTDPRGAVLARAPGFAAAGSADDLLSVATGDGQLGPPLIVVAIQTGGHRENTISLAIYRIGDRRRLEQLFMKPIEEHDGDQTAMGALTFVPAGLVYRAPGARSATKWTFDAGRRRYLEQGASDPSPSWPQLRWLTDALRAPAA